MFRVPPDRPASRRRPRPVGARLQVRGGSDVFKVILRPIGPADGSWMAVCDDDLPIHVEDGGAGVVVVLTWLDETTTSAFLGPPTPRMREEAIAAGVTWPETRRFLTGPGAPPPALISRR